MKHGIDGQNRTKEVQSSDSLVTLCLVNHAASTGRASDRTAPTSLPGTSKLMQIGLKVLESSPLAGSMVLGRCITENVGQDQSKEMSHRESK